MIAVEILQNGAIEHFCATSRNVCKAVDSTQPKSCAMPSPGNYCIFQPVSHAGPYFDVERSLSYRLFASVVCAMCLGSLTERTELECACKLTDRFLKDSDDLFLPSSVVFLENHVNTSGSNCLNYSILSLKFCAIYFHNEGDDDDVKKLHSFKDVYLVIPVEM